MTDDRLEQIRAAVDRAENRMSADRAFVLVTACRDLLAEVARLRAEVPTQRRLEEIA